MSVVVWDWKALAADMAGFSGGLKFLSRKLFRFGDLVIGWVGTEYTGRLMMGWYMQGHDPEKYPAENSGEDWSRLIVGRRTPSGIEVVTYECAPIAMPVDAPYMAWGSAGEVAMGALAAGANAEKAVQIAIKHHQDCGFGVQVEVL